MEHLPENSTKLMLSQSKMKASEQLKKRVLHQIDAEKALIAKKTHQKNKSNGVLFPFWILYVVSPMASVFYLSNNNINTFLQSPLFLLLVLIGVTCSAFWALTYYDDKRLQKK